MSTAIKRTAARLAPAHLKPTLRPDARRPLGPVENLTRRRPPLDDGRANLGAVGSNLSRLASDFDSRTWGFAKLKDLMVAHPSFDVESRPTGEGKAPNAYVRRAVRK